MTFHDDAVSSLYRWDFRDKSPSLSTFEKVFDFSIKNKFTVGVITFLVAGFGLATYLIKRSSPTFVIRENVQLKSQNKKLKGDVDDLEKKIEKLNDKMEGLEKSLETAGAMCVICQDQSLSRSFVPCGHAVCTECSEKVKKCPFCNQRVERIIARY